MTEPLNRDEIIALLERLGEEDDAAVLEAARALHASVAESGTSWADLLVPEGGGEAADAAPEAADTAPEAAAAPTGGGGGGGDALALIDKLLARSGITEDFRREMEGYKADIADGTFADADLKYLRALDKRLSGKN